MASTILPHNRTALLLRRALLAIIALDLILIGTRVLLYTPFFAQPNAMFYLLAPVVLLLIYAAVVVAITARLASDRQVALRTGTMLGVITGVMWILNLAGETFTSLQGSIGILSTAPFLLGGFALWGVAAFLVARRTGSVGSGILTAVCSAMLCVLLTIAFGFLLTYTSLGRLEHDLFTDPDYLTSGWSDLRAFALANTCLSACTHLLGALCIGAVCGTIGAMTGRLVRKSFRPMNERQG